ncbi:MAG: ABC transporter permease [Bacteroidia bacterium]
MAFLLKENIKIALGSVKSQALRATLTALIIAIGIMALVGILTAIDAIKSSINTNFTSMGANTFTIRNRETSVRIGKKGKKPKRFRSITYEEARRFKEEFNFPATVSISTIASFTAKLSYESKKSNPNIQVFGSDENYVSSSGYEIDKGRNFSNYEIYSGSPVVIIGQEIRSSLFKPGVNAVDKVIRIGSGKYKVIGVLKSKGTSMGFGGDKICVIPVQNARQYFSQPNATFTINVISENPQLMDVAIGEATGLFRKVRKVDLGDDENFEITKSDNLANILIDNIKKVTLGATLIGGITLLGAAIGLMNIMLVSVTERTREIGVRKALGATQKSIRNQFLIESIVICQLGGIFGILFGMGIGNLISFQLGVGFYVPWKWIIGGVILCVAVGLMSGFIPARRASKLDPIESLRFE